MADFEKIKYKLLQRTVQFLEFLSGKRDPDPGRGLPEVERIHRQLKSKKWEALCREFGQMPIDLQSLCLNSVTSRLKKPDVILPGLQMQPNSYIPHLFYGVAMIEQAWRERSSQREYHVTREMWEKFGACLHEAYKSLHVAIELKPEHPEAYACLIPVCMGLQLNRELMWRNFEQVAQLEPEHYLGYANFCNAITKKWGGSHEECFAFAKRCLESAKPGSPIVGIVAMTHIEFWLYHHSWEDGDRDRAATYFDEPQVISELCQAYEILNQGDPERLKWFANEARNNLAWALYKAKQYDLCKDAVDKIGKRVTDRPWFYPQEGLEGHRLYNHVRKKLGMRPFDFN